MHRARRGRRRRSGPLSGLLLLSFGLLVTLPFLRWSLHTHTGPQFHPEVRQRWERALFVAELTAIATLFLGISFPLEWRSREQVGALRRTHRQLRERHRRLRASNQRYELAMEGARDILWDWDPRTKLLHLAPRWRAALGSAATSGDVPLSEWWDRVHEEDRAALEQTFEELRRGSRDVLEFEHRVLRHDGSDIWLLCRGAVHRDGDGRVSRVAGSFTDVSKSRRQREALRRRAYFDDLTGVANRGHLLGRLEHRSVDRGRDPGSFAVLFLDLDGFKEVNDRWGHAIGDALLEQVARRLEAGVRDRDLVARVGGDEYAVLLDQVEDQDDALSAARRLCRKLSEPYDLHGHPFRTRASVGVVCSRGEQPTPAAELLRRADLAMYVAKAEGKGRVRAWNPDLDARHRPPCPAHQPRAKAAAAAASRARG